MLLFLPLLLACVRADYEVRGKLKVRCAHTLAFAKIESYLCMWCACVRKYFCSVLLACFSNLVTQKGDWHCWLSHSEKNDGFHVAHAAGTLAHTLPPSDQTPHSSAAESFLGSIFFSGFSKKCRRSSGTVSVDLKT